METLAASLAREIGCEFYLNKTMRGVTYGFNANPPDFKIIGKPIITGEDFEISTGVNHNLYDTHKLGYDALLSTIRKVVESF